MNTPANRVTWIWQRSDWPDWRWHDERLRPALEEISRTRHFLRGIAHALDDEHLKQVIAELVTREAVSTSAIENVRLDLAAIRSSVLRRLGLAMSKERANLAGPAARGLIDILVDSVEDRSALTEERLLRWHAALFPRGYSDSLPVLAGAFRGSAQPMRVVSGRIGAETVHFEAPPADRLPGEIARFLEWFNGDSRRQPASLRAAIAHLWFETLHPFEDGNGRIGRAIMDLAMAQDTAPADRSTARLWAVSRVFEARRSEYYDQLEEAQRGDLEITAWLEWALRSMSDAQRQAQDVVDKVTAVTRFWVRHAATPLNARQRKVLQRLLSPAEGDSPWLTTRNYAKIAGTPKITAARDIRELVDFGCIEQDPESAGRSTRYRVRV
ncbi:MAG: Fic family protein [Arenimonas sp.]